MSYVVVLGGAVFTVAGSVSGSSVATSLRVGAGGVNSGVSGHSEHTVGVHELCISLLLSLLLLPGGLTRLPSYHSMRRS